MCAARRQLISHTGRSAKGGLLHCRRALTLSQTSDVVIRMKAARGGLQERDDLLSQQPLAAGPYFFSMKSPDPSDQEIVPVPSRMTPALHAEALSQPRTNVHTTSCHQAAPRLLYILITTETCVTTDFHALTSSTATTANITCIVFNALLCGQMQFTY